jgi:RHS repeat-associated protein
VISDKVIPHPSGSSVAYYKADILQSQDYSPFGVTLRGRNLKRSGLTEDFRLGYQGSEKDNELKGEGNSYTTFYRMLDPRLGRWFSCDPVIQAHQSPYNSMDNNPILLNDPLGDKVKIGEKGKEKRELKRMIREARKHDADFDAWYRSKQTDGNYNVLKFSDKSNSDPNRPTQFTSPIYREANAAGTGTSVTINPGGVETAGTSLKGYKGVTGYYNFDRLERQTTETDNQRVGNDICSVKPINLKGFRYDETTNTYNATIKLKENNFTLNEGYVNPAGFGGVNVNIRITENDGSLITSFNVFRGGGDKREGVYYAPRLLVSNSREINIQITATGGGSTYTNWSVSTTTNTTKTTSKWGFNPLRLFRLESLINL